MENSPFGRLPQELRDEIYTLVLPQDRDVQLRILETRQEKNGNGTQTLKKMKVTRDSGLHRFALAITTVCKQARRETIPIFIQDNRFDFRTRVFCIAETPLNNGHIVRDISDINVFCRWIKGMINKHSITRAPHINIDLGTVLKKNITSQHWFRNWAQEELIRLITKPNTQIEWTMSFATFFDSKKGTPRNFIPAKVTTGFSRVALASPHVAIDHALDGSEDQLWTRYVERMINRKCYGENVKELNDVGGLARTFVSEIQWGVEKAKLAQ